MSLCHIITSFLVLSMYHCWSPGSRCGCKLDVKILYALFVIKVLYNYGPRARDKGKYNIHNKAKEA